MMKKIYELGFALDDTVLFLDTHPRDKEALNYYHQLAKEYNETVMKYNNNYGPLTSNCVENDNYFTWINKPMPWEGDV